MIRTAAALTAAVAILASASVGAAHVARAGAEARAEAEIAVRHQVLAQELDHWRGAEGEGFAAAGTATEARRTLELLRELYAQEQRLWDYYHTLEAQHDTRSELARERLELERRVARHEHRLEALDASLERLRPVEDQAPIDFTDATN